MNRLEKQKLVAAAKIASDILSHAGYKVERLGAGTNDCCIMLVKDGRVSMMMQVANGDMVSEAEAIMFFHGSIYNHACAS